MNAYPVLGFKTIAAAVAATGTWTVSRLRSPIKVETCLQRECGFVVREIRISFSWKPGRARRSHEWVLYFTGKSLPAAKPIELPTPDAPLS